MGLWSPGNRQHVHTCLQVLTNPIRHKNAKLASAFKTEFFVNNKNKHLNKEWHRQLNKKNKQIDKEINK